VLASPPVADQIAVAEVWLWDRLVGAVAEDANGAITYEYSPEFARQGLEISPIKLPLSQSGPVTFPELTRLEAFAGLPGVLADALPDRFGNALIRKYFADKGEPDKGLSSVQRLLYMGRRALGALEFRPAIKLRTKHAEQEALQLARLVAEARRIVGGAVDAAVPQLMRVGSSAGGARPKAIVLWNRATKELRSDFAETLPGDERWIMKFDGVGDLGAPDFTPRPYNRIEYAYSGMARAAGINVPDTLLMEERGLAHFMIKRFDRDGDSRVHMHTLGGMHHVDYNQPGLFSYEQYLRTVLQLNCGYGALEEAFRRTVFNFAAVNQDDHVKNFSFLMDTSGTWSLAPSYDVTYAKGRTFTRVHQMTLAGKSSGITRRDLLQFGKDMDIKHDGEHVIQQVADSLATWETHASEARVPVADVERIGAELRTF
jgi:serine/threonine-protein kinase HipA